MVIDDDVDAFSALMVVNRKDVMMWVRRSRVGTSAFFKAAFPTLSKDAHQIKVMLSQIVNIGVNNRMCIRARVLVSISQ